MPDINIGNAGNAAVIIAAMKYGKEYIGLVVKPSLEQIGGMLSDRITTWRRNNMGERLAQTGVKIENREIPPEKMRTPSEAEFLPLLEAASNTDDPTLSDMFASLLASQFDPATYKGVHPSFITTMGQLSPLDARILKLTDNKEHINFENDGKWGPATDKKLFEELLKQTPDITESEISLSILNLDKTGLCMKMPFNIGRATISDLVITEYGECFLKACSEPSYWRLGLETQPGKINRKAKDPEQSELEEQVDYLGSLVSKNQQELERLKDMRMH